MQVKQATKKTIALTSMQEQEKNTHTPPSPTPPPNTTMTDGTPQHPTHTIPQSGYQPVARKSGKKVPVGAVSIYPGGDLFAPNVISETAHSKKAKREPVNTGGLFDDEEDDLFGSNVKTSGADKTESKLATSLFDESEDSGLFEASVTPKPVKGKSGAQQNAQLHSELVESSPPLVEKSQTSSGLFSDDDDSQDLFSSNKATKRHQSKQSLVQNTSSQIPVSFFNDEGDLFSSAPSNDLSAIKKSQQPHEPKTAATGSKSAALFDSDDKDEWQSLGQQTISASQSVGEKKQEVPKAAATSRAPKKTSLFDYPEEGDLFGVTQKESQKKSHKVSLLFEDDDEGDLFASKPAANKPPPSQKPSPPQSSPLFGEIESNHSVTEFDGKRQVEQGAGGKPVSVGTTHLFAGSDILEQSDTKVLVSEAVVAQECDDLAKPSVAGLLGELHSNLNSVVSLFDEDEDENLEDVHNQCKLMKNEKLPEGGVSTRVFQDEELLFSQQQQKDNDPDVDLFADALKSEVKTLGKKPPVSPPPTEQARLPELPSSDLFDGTDDLFSTSKPRSVKVPSTKDSIFGDGVDADLFRTVPKKPSVTQTKPKFKGTGMSWGASTKTSEHPKEACGEVLEKQRPGDKERSFLVLSIYTSMQHATNSANLEKITLSLSLCFQLVSEAVVAQECDDLAKPSVAGLLGELHSNLNSVVSLFDEDEDENLEDVHNQCKLMKNEKLPEGGVSTRVFQDEELLFSQQQQKDNDPDVDLFADALKSEVKTLGKKPPVSPPPTEQARPPELPSSDLFDGTDDLFSTSKPRSVKVPSTKDSIFGDGVDADLFRTVPKKPSVTQTKPKFKGTGMSWGASTKTSEHPKEACDEVLEKQRPGDKERLTANTGPIKTKGPSSRIGKLQASLAINPASLLPGAAPKIAVVPSGSTTPPSSPDSSLRAATPSASGSVAGEGISASLDQPVQVDVLPSVNKSRARVGQKRRPPTRVARRLAAQQSNEREDLDQRTEVDGVLLEANGIADISPTVIVQKPHLAKTPTSQQPSSDASPPTATSTKLPVRSSRDLFDSGDLFKPNVTQESTPAVRTLEGLLPKEDPVQSIFAPSEDDLFQSSKRTVKKPKPVAFLQEEDDLFGTPKLGKTKHSAQENSKTPDIFEDDLFSTESVTLTKKSNEGIASIDLFSDHVDIFADLKVTPKEKKSRKKVETKSIFDDDMDDIFASASPSSNSKKQSKPKTSSKQAAVPVSTADSKTVDIFDDPLNAFGP
ncbi:WASH complex subunit 2 [Chiloscyllium plagiosum]|uniref:WASH complex subunit 2 n=1 Tax=Chiloscyllium plagiosum TaxID=36176 RepID=UPI001CB7CACF|nr:WASH complex subunit 2 [Chiloscyllium plagiosum]